MKFKDIPQFTRVGFWQTNMGWKYFLEWIDENIKESNLQLNPDFQRGHVWTEEQQVVEVLGKLCTLTVPAGWVILAEILSVLMDCNGILR